ncbi:nipblb [Symbiodinium sp. CCMP2592]|nr:nipblb [Symbiodinium sp. CCMP2592]
MSVNGVEKFAKAEFVVELDLTKVAGLGLEVDWADGKTLFIKSVKVGDGGVDSTSASSLLELWQAEGAVPSWNKKHAASAVAAGDRVISINGKAGDPKARPEQGIWPPAMLAVCKKEKQLSLLVRAGSNDAAQLLQRQKCRQKASNLFGNRLFSKFLASDPLGGVAVGLRNELSEVISNAECGIVSKAVKKVASSIASAVQNSLAALPSSEDGGKPKQSPKFFDFNATYSAVC